MKLAIISRHFTEYCFRYANAMALYADVLLILDKKNMSSEWDLSKIPVNPRLKVYFHDLTVKRGGGLSLLHALFRIYTFKPDIAHFQELLDPFSTLIMLLSRPVSKLILTIHDPTPHSGEDSRIPLHLRLLTYIQRKIARAYIVHGAFCERALLDHNPSYQGKVIASTHGVLMTPYAKLCARDETSVLFFGRMHRYKGLDVLIESSRLLSEQNINHKIIIAGRGPELTRLKTQIQNNPAFEIHDRYVSPDELSGFYQRCGFVVMPYLDATQSGVAAGAFGNERPVVASKVGGLPDIIKHGENGLLVPPQDATALAKAMGSLLENNTLLTQLSLGAKESASTSLNWDLIAHELFRELNSRFM